MYLKKDEPIAFIVTILPKNTLHRLLQRCKVVRSKRILNIEKSVFSTMTKISKIMIKLNPEGKVTASSFQETLLNNSDALPEIIAISVINNGKDARKSLVKFIKRNFTAEELLAACKIVWLQLGIPDFIYCLHAIRGFNVLESNYILERN